MTERFNRALLIAGVVGVWLLVLQNLGLVPRLRPLEATIRVPVPVHGQVEVENTVDVTGSVSVDSIWDTVDVNFARIVGRELIESERGMYIGVASTDNHVIPIHWGDVSVD